METEAAYLQIRSTHGSVRWYDLGHIRNLSKTDRAVLRLQASLLSTYLAELGREDQSLSISRANSIDAIRKSAENIRQGYLKNGCLFKSHVESTLSIIEGEVPTAKSYREKSYIEAIWLISRVLGKGNALIAACTTTKRDPFDRVTLIHVIAQMSSEPDLQLSNTISKGLFEGYASSVPEKTSHSCDTSPSPPTIVCEIPGKKYWQKLSSYARGFFNFLCSLKFDAIPEQLLLRMMQRREIWAPNGCICSIDPPSDPIVHDLTSGVAYDYIVLFVTCGFMYEQKGAFQRNIYVIPPHIHEEFGHGDVQTSVSGWSRLVLVCHAFPGRWEEPWFIDHGRILLPQLQHALDHCPLVKNHVIEDPTRGYSVLLSLILSTTIPDLTWKTKAIEVTENILAGSPAFEPTDTNYLKGLLQLRKRQISTRVQNAQFDNASDVPPPTDPRSNSVYGMDLRFEAQRLIMADTPFLDGAIDKMKAFSIWAESSASPIEQHELKMHEFMRCKIFRWKGQFEEAVRRLEPLTGFFGDDFNDIGCSVWSHYVGTLCEVQLFKDAEYWSRHAIASFEKLQAAGIPSERQKRYRLLRLCLAETIVSQNMARYRVDLYSNQSLGDSMKEASSIYADLDAEYKRLKRRDWASRLEHLRVFLGRAIIAHLSVDTAQAARLWKDLEDPVQDCRKGHQITDFLPMIMDYSRCDLAARRADYNEAHRMLNQAKFKFGSIGREHWWTCIGTQFLDLLRDSLSRNSLMSGIN